MKNKELIEILLKGLIFQYKELGKEFGVEGNADKIALARIATIDKIIELEELKKEDEFMANVISSSCEPIKFSLENISTDELIDELEKRVAEDLKGVPYNPAG